MLLVVLQLRRRMYSTMVTHLVICWGLTMFLVIFFAWAKVIGYQCNIVYCCSWSKLVTTFIWSNEDIFSHVDPLSVLVCLIAWLRLKCSHWFITICTAVRSLRMYFYVIWGVREHSISRFTLLNWWWYSISFSIGWTSWST